METNIEVLRAKETTERLAAVNRDVKSLLERLPLKRHEDVARLHTLIKQQEQFMRSKAGNVTTAVQALLDNEKHRARHLQTLYREAVQRGRLRRSAGP